MIICADVRLLLWIIGLSICTTMSYNIPDNDIVLTDDTVSSIDKEDWSDKMNVDESVRLAARKPTFQTDHRSPSLNSPEHGNLRALWKIPTINKDKPDAMSLLSDKRAFMHDPFETMTKQLDANTDTLETLTTDIGMMKSEIISKLDGFKTMSEAQKVNATALTTLAEDVKTIKSKTVSMDSEFKALSSMQKANAEDIKIMKEQLMSKLDELTSITEVLNTNVDKSHDLVSDQFQNISKTVKSNSEKLDDFTKHVAMQPFYSSCLVYRDAGHTKSGEYKIRIPNNKNVVTVYCDQKTDGGGWLVIQRRNDGSVDFYRDWGDYKIGFGDVSGEFWMGNEHLHSLTRDQQELRVDLVDFNGNTAYAKYASFSVGSESENYKLSVSGFSGTAGDSLKHHNGQEFSTKDRDNDGQSSYHCSQHFKGGWWYRACHFANLNGLYYHRARHDSTGVTWWDWKNKQESLKKSEMKIRPKQ